MARTLPKKPAPAKRARKKPAAKVVASGKKATAAAKAATASAAKAKSNGAANGNAPKIGDNVVARAKVIADTISDLHRLDGEIAEAREKNVKPLTDRRRKMIRTLKADTGVNREILDAQLKMFAIAKKTSELEDPDHRESVFEQMTEVHAALHPGQQVNWLDVVERAAAV